MTTHTRAWRPWAAATAVSVTALTGALLVPSTAVSAPPAEDCAEPFAVADLTPGQAVTGLTVHRGTVPAGFTGEVLGVLNDGIGPGLDMVMVRLTSTEIDRVGGIWAGMSGSPVYAADGKLIGAVAYGLSWGPSPVAGVTPFEDMDDYLASTPEDVPVPRAVARKIAAKTDLTVAEAAQGFTELPMSLGVSGVRPARLAAVADKPYLSKSARAMGAPAAAGEGPGAETIVAGGNLAFGASYGDVTIAATGTATSVCGGKVVGFGHPATFGGPVKAGLHPADAIYVQEDSTGGSFKVANIGAPVGTITDDRQTGVTGIFGPLPEESPVVSTLTYGSRTGSGESSVVMPDYAASTVYYQLVGVHDRVVDAKKPGSEDQSWTIIGEGPGGEFTLEMGDRFVSSYDIGDTAAYSLADLVWVLSNLPGVEVTSVTVDGDVIDDATTWRVASMEYKAGAKWTKVKPRKTVRAVAGRPLKVRAVLTGDLGSTTVPMTVPIPRKLAGARGVLSLEGGGSQYVDYWEISSLKEFMKVARSDARNDAVVATVATDTGRRGYSSTVESAPSDKVVEGGKWFRLVVGR